MAHCGVQMEYNLTRKSFSHDRETASFSSIGYSPSIW